VKDNNHEKALCESSFPLFQYKGNLKPLKYNRVSYRWTFRFCVILCTHFMLNTCYKSNYCFWKMLT